MPLSPYPGCETLAQCELLCHSVVRVMVLLFSELRQELSPDADVPNDDAHSSAMMPHASLERQVSSVSLAESEYCPSLATLVKGTTPFETETYSCNGSISHASSCSHDENLHRPSTHIPPDSIHPLSACCQNKTPVKHNFGVSGKGSAKPPQTPGVERTKVRDHVRPADPHSKALQNHHGGNSKQEWRMGGSSIRVRPDSSRPKSALVTSSSLGPPVTPRRTKVISPHKARTPDMSRLLGTPRRSRPAARRARNLSLRSSLEEFPVPHPFSQGGAGRRATIAPGTLLPSFKSDMKFGVYLIIPWALHVMCHRAHVRDMIVFQVRYIKNVSDGFNHEIEPSFRHVQFMIVHDGLIPVPSALFQVLLNAFTSMA